jgi:hypothetical protein
VFEAEVLGENEAMMQVFRDGGYPMDAKVSYGTYHVSFPIEPTAAAEEAAARRAMIAATASLGPFFNPRSVAVIGASRDRGTIGGELFRNVLQNEFTGVVYPVNPNAEWVGGVKSYASVLDVPDAVDLAVIVVPAEKVLEIAEECTRKGVRGMVVITAGFGETGSAGREREAALLRMARNYDPADRPELYGRAERAPVGLAERDVLAGLSAVRQRRAAITERGARPGAAGLCEDAEHRPVDVHQRGEQGGRIRQRPDPVLGRR